MQGGHIMSATFPFEKMCGATAESEWFQAFLLKFQEKYSTNELATEEIYKRAGIKASECMRCGKKDVPREAGGRILKCDRCNKQRRLTAGTFFHGMKKPIPILFILLLLEEHVIISSSYCEDLEVLDIRQSSAWEQIQKFLTALIEKMGEDAATVLSDVLIEVCSKRSRETPARKHPMEEQTEMERQSAKEKRRYSADQSDLKDECGSENSEGRSEESTDNDRASNSGGPVRARQENQNNGEFTSEYATKGEEAPILSNLESPDGGKKVPSIVAGQHSSNDESKCESRDSDDQDSAIVALKDFASMSPVETDSAVLGVLCEEPMIFDEVYERSGKSVADVTVSLFKLELLGRVKRDRYGRYKRSSEEQSRKKPSAALRTKSSQFKEFIEMFYGGISRKHEQKYAIAFWIYWDKNVWRDCSVFEFLRDRKPPSIREIRNYVTPLDVKMMPAE